MPYFLFVFCLKSRVKDEEKEIKIYNVPGTSLQSMLITVLLIRAVVVVGFLVVVVGLFVVVIGLAVVVGLRVVLGLDTVVAGLTVVIGFRVVVVAACFISSIIFPLP